MDNKFILENLEYQAKIAKLLDVVDISMLSAPLYSDGELKEAYTENFTCEMSGKFSDRNDLIYYFKGRDHTFQIYNIRDQQFNTLCKEYDEDYKDFKPVIIPDDILKSISDEIFEYGRKTNIQKFVKLGTKLVFETTISCPLRCIHCYCCAGPDACKDICPKNVITHYVDDANSVYNPFSILMTGGDPFDADKINGGNYLFPVIQHSLNKGLCIVIKSSYDWTRKPGADEYYKQFEKLNFDKGGKLQMEFSIDGHHANCAESAANLLAQFINDPKLYQVSKYIRFLAHARPGMEDDINVALSQRGIIAEKRSEMIEDDFFFGMRDDYLNFEYKHGVSLNVVTNRGKIAKVGRALENDIGEELNPEMGSDRRLCNEKLVFSTGKEFNLIFKANGTAGIGFPVDIVQEYVPYTNIDDGLKEISDIKFEIARKIYTKLEKIYK